jgi:hypothetical protein
VRDALQCSSRHLPPPWVSNECLATASAWIRLCFWTTTIAVAHARIRATGCHSTRKPQSFKSHPPLSIFTFAPATRRRRKPTWPPERTTGPGRTRGGNPDRSAIKSGDSSYTYPGGVSESPRLALARADDCWRRTVGTIPREQTQSPGSLTAAGPRRPRAESTPNRSFTVRAKPISTSTRNNDYQTGYDAEPAPFRASNEPNCGDRAAMEKRSGHPSLSRDRSQTTLQLEPQSQYRLTEQKQANPRRRTNPIPASRAGAILRDGGAARGDRKARFRARTDPISVVAFQGGTGPTRRRRGRVRLRAILRVRPKSTRTTGRF